MKLFKLSFLAGLAAVLVMGLTGSAFAFHTGGVAVCDSCHSMHNSAKGLQMIVSAGTNTSSLTGTDVNQSNTGYLLKGSDQSSTCLNCHGSDTQSSYHELTTNQTGTTGIPENFSPGGDFAWLLISNDPNKNPGTGHGHNIVAADFGLVGDSVLTQAPGGTYPATYTGNDGTQMGMACSSCHDPHGRYRQDSTGAISGGASGTPATLPIAESGSYPITAFPTDAAIGVYRLLGGVGYIPKSLVDAGGDAGLAFTAPSPIAVAPKTYNQNEVTGQTNTGTTGTPSYYGGKTVTIATQGEVRVAYGSGMSEWCANCHTYMLNSAADASTTHRHPVGAAAKMTIVADNYNHYLGSGNMTGDNAYTSLIPFEEGTDNYTDIIDLGTRAGDSAPINGPAGTGGGIAASSTTNVMCLSCHRAHATAFPQDGRWDFNDELMVEDGAYNGMIGGYGTTIGYSDAQYTAAMYGRTAAMFATYQRSLCNKCHAKD